MTCSKRFSVSPEIYENGTQYVINHKLDFEMLKVLSDNDELQNIVVTVYRKDNRIRAVPQLG